MSERTASSRPTNGRRRARRFALASALVVLSLGLAEIAARGLLAVLGRPYDAGQARALLGTWVNAVGSRVPLPEEENGQVPRFQEPEGSHVLHPYVAWESSENGLTEAADADYFASQRAQIDYDIHVLGGSVGHIFAVEGRERLLERLSADPRFAGRPIRIHGYARPGYKQPQQLLLFCYLLNLGHAPDAVINLDGFNEVALGWNNVEGNTNPVYPSRVHWAGVSRDVRIDWTLVEILHRLRAAQTQAHSFGVWAVESGVWRSCVLGHVAVYRLRALRNRYFRVHLELSDLVSSRGQDAVVGGPPYEHGLPGLQLIVRSWEESSRILGAICAERSIRYLHVLQPTLHDAGSKPLTPEEVATSGTPPAWIEGTREGYPLLRVAGERLRERGIAFLDASRLFQEVREPLYYDGCHFRRPGNELLADAVAAALLEDAR